MRCGDVTAKSSAAGLPPCQEGKYTSAGRLLLDVLGSSGLGGSRLLFSSSGLRPAVAVKVPLLLRTLW
eukprot:9361614-Karenia_brevis.AAC.1